MSRASGIRLLAWDCLIVVVVAVVLACGRAPTPTPPGPRGDPLAIPAGQGVVIRRVPIDEDGVVCYARGEALSCVKVTEVRR